VVEDNLSALLLVKTFLAIGELIVYYLLLHFRVLVQLKCVAANSQTRLKKETKHFLWYMGIFYSQVTNKVHGIHVTWIFHLILPFRQFTERINN
jgi:hypothetical protein